MTIKKICSNCVSEETYQNILAGHYCRLTRVKDGERKEYPPEEDGVCCAFKIRTSLEKPDRKVNVTDIVHSAIE